MRNKSLIGFPPRGHPGNLLAGIHSHKRLDPDLRHAGVTGFNQSRGQLIVEFVLALFLWGALMSGFIFLAQGSLVRQRAHSAARLGALLLGTGRVADETVRAEIKNILEQSSQPEKVEWLIQTRPYKDTVAARFYHLVQTTVVGNWGRFKITERVAVEQEQK